LAFVTLRHQITQNGARAVTEWQDLVYRQDPGPATRQPAPPMAPADENPVEHRFSTTLLFRYSALTFNGHRIHYDLDYCRDVEGYPGLVVHGPLLAQLLMLRAARPLHRFGFRATAPLFHTETATLCAQGGVLWVRGPDGRLCMTAEAA
jgi:3-methylfumaryl-CoA hydratase